MTAHTPTPYSASPPLRFGEAELLAGNKAIALFYCSDGHDEPTPFPGHANAVFAARACNENADLHATVAALRKALGGLDEVLDFDGECEGTQIIERPAVPELRAAMLAARAALALRDPAP